MTHDQHHSPSRRPARLLAGLALVAAGGLALAGCTSATNAEEGGGDGLQIVATTTQLTDFTREIVGSDAEVTGLLAPGASAHSFDPTPADLLALGKADVLVVNGGGLETFVDAAVESSGFSGTIIDASDGIDQAEAKEISGEEGEVHADEHADEAHAEEAHADEAHADEAHAEESGEHADEHDHGDVDPHFWTAPRFASLMVGEIADGVAKADPDHASDFEKRADAYREKLDALDAWNAEQFAAVPEADRVLVSGHDSLGYYMHDYGIEFAGAILPSFADNAEPSAAEIDELVQHITERGVKAVFVESSMSPRLAETIASEAGVKVIDGEKLYTDSLGTKDSDADTYLGATIHNTRLILESWGAIPGELPATLQG